MYESTLDYEIYSKIRRLNKNQKSEVLNYLERVPKKTHRVKLKRRKAMKQINEALKSL